MLFFKELTKTLLENYDINKYQFDCIPVEGTKNKNQYILSTLRHSLRHKNIEITKNLKKCMETFKFIIKKDKLVAHEKTIILVEFYKIIHHIGATNVLLEVIKNKEEFKYLPFRFNKADLRKENSRLKGNYIKTVTPFSSKVIKEIKLYNLIYTSFIKNRKLTNFYFHSIALIDIEKFKLLENESEENQEKIFNILDKFLIQYTNKNDILKSLSILIYFELTYYLGFTNEEAKIHTQSLMYHLHEYTPNFEEFNKNIYIKATLGLIPIFASKKAKYYDEKEKKFIKKSILETVDSKEKLTKEEDNFLEIILNDYLRNPQKTYLTKYPKELFLESKK